MSKSERQLQSWRGIAAVVALLLLVALCLTGCGGPAGIVAVEPTATLYPPPPTDIPAPPPGPTPAALSFPLPAPAHGEAETVDDQSCVDCHTDEEMLKAVAKPEEGAAETLSEGEG